MFFVGALVWLIGMVGYVWGLHAITDTWTKTFAVLGLSFVTAVVCGFGSGLMKESR